MKRKLSLLMVLMMVLTLIPAMPSFAATANRVDRTVSVTSDGKTTGNAPNLVIDLDGKGDVKAGQTFRIELSEYAEWLNVPANIVSNAAFVPTTTGTVTAVAGNYSVTPITAVVNGVTITLNKDYTAGGLTVNDMVNDIIAQVNAISGLTATAGAPGSGNYTINSDYSMDIVVGAAPHANFGLTAGTINATAVANTDGEIVLNKVSDRRIEVTVLSAGIDAIFQIPLDVQFNGAPEGAQKVTIVPGNSGVSGADYTFATIGAGEVTMKVDSKTKISRSGNQTVSFIIDEIAIDSFKNANDYTLKLPKDFAWGTGAGDVVITGGAAVIESINDRELKIDVNAADSTKLQSIFVSAKIVPSRDAKFGDVAINVTRGTISPSTLVIAEYVDYAGTVNVEKVLDVVSGKNEDALYVAKIKLEEPVNGTFLQGRFIEFSFNKDVAALQDETTLKLDHKSGSAALSIDKSSSKAFDTATTTVVNGVTVNSAIDIDTNTTTPKSSDKWDVEVLKSSVGATKSRFDLEIPFVVSANFEGDVVLTVQGAGIEKQDVVIAKAKKAVTVEIDKNSSADLKIGVQKQSAPDIIITETQAGALSEDAFYKIANRYKDAGIVWKAAKIEVIEGDLELHDDTDYVSDGIELIVETKSTKASKIKISGVEVTLDRTVPYGPFEVDFNFGEVAKMGSKQDVVHTDLSNRVARIPYFNVVTPAPGDQNATTTFTMDSTTYTMIINGQPQTMTMDVAPFIQDNRAMLPIKYVADAIGAKVNYDPMSRVATFTKDATVAALYLDSNVLYVNGTPVTMDTKPVISNGRAMVPVIYVAQAFGFQYGTDLVYDAATKSVTIFPVAK